MVVPYFADPAAISADSVWPGERLAAWYASLDPAVQNRQPFITSQVTISMWFLSGFCAVMALGFGRGWNRIRTPAVVFAGGSMTWVADWLGTLSVAYPGQLGEGRTTVLAVHLTVVALDLGLVYRFWRDDPFGANVLT